TFYEYFIRYIDQLRIHVFKRKLIMRINLVSFLILLSFVHVFATGRAQQISFKASAPSAERIFSEIRKQTGYTVLYSGLSLKGVTFSNIDFEKTPLKTALSQLSETKGWNYEIDGKTILLRQKRQASRTTSTNTRVQDPIQGIVKDEMGNPLGGATIRIKNESETTAGSDTDGTFSIMASDGQVLIVNMIGYLSKEVALGVEKQIEIIMEPDVLGMEE